MILDEKTLRAVKENLLKIHYPKAEILMDSQIKELFTKEYRSHLLAHLFGLLIDSSNDKQPTESKELEKLLCSFGLCKEADINIFISDDLPSAKQLTIFNRFFLLISASNSVEMSENRDITPEMINEHITQELNIFPEFGPLKNYSQEKRNEILTECKTINASLDSDYVDSMAKLVKDDSLIPSVPPYETNGIALLKELENAYNKCVVSKSNNLISQSEPAANAFGEKISILSKSLQELKKIVQATLKLTGDFTFDGADLTTSCDLRDDVRNIYSSLSSLQLKLGVTE